MRIRVRSLTGEQNVYLIGENDTIAVLKRRIMIRDGIPVASQHLIFNNEELSNDTVIMQQEGVTEDSVLQLVINMRGGPLTMRMVTVPADLSPFLQNNDGVAEEDDDDNDGDHTPRQASNERRRSSEVEESTKEPPVIEMALIMMEANGRIHFIRANYRSSETFENLPLAVESEAANGPSSSTSLPRESLATGSSSSRLSPTEASNKDKELHQKMAVLKLKIDCKRFGRRLKEVNVASTTSPTNPAEEGVAPSGKNGGLRRSLSLGMSPLTEIPAWNTAPARHFESPHNAPPPPLSRTHSVQLPAVPTFLTSSTTSASVSKPPKNEPQSPSGQSSLPPLVSSATSSSATSSSSLLRHRISRRVSRSNLTVDKLPPLSELDTTTLTSHNQSSETTETGDKKPSAANQQRCPVCGKRLGLATTFECRCGLMLCPKHRYPEEHKCTVDYKGEAKNQLRRENPQILANKLTKI